VTTIEPLGAFWEAEPEHQDYLQRIPIRFNSGPTPIAEAIRA
jgi:peptide methionine sulfoxide reductase MsrA